MSQEDFLWGAATSSHQIEGYNEHNDWWAWEAQGRIEGGVRSGPATDHWNRRSEDIRMAAELGLNSYRFSVEWSRVEPEDGRWDESALDWYEALIDDCEKHGMMPMLTLHHFTSPEWFAKLGGFTWEDGPARFAAFAERVVRRLGSRVPIWCTLNEPMVLITGTYLGKFMPPAVFSPQAASAACRNLLRCHVAAYDIIHSQVRERKGPWKDVPLRVGIAHNTVDFMPDRKWHPIEQFLAAVFHRFYNRSWLDAVTGRKQIFGIPGLMPSPAVVKEARGRRTCEYLGINYYTKGYVQWRPRDASTEQPSEVPIGLAFARRKEVASDLGWAVHPEGFRKMLRFAGGYDLPIYVTENGIADRDDDLRPQYLLSHLQALSRAIQDDGVDIRGYYHWSLLDNFEWIKGFWPRFGLFQVNYDSFERTRTHSADLYRRIIEAHRVTGNKIPSETILKGV